MSKQESEYECSLSAPNLQMACQQVVQSLIDEGWRMNEQSPDKLLIRQPLALLSTRNPVTVEINIQSVSSNKSKMTFTASNFGFGPIQTNHCKKAIQEVYENFVAAVKIVSAAQQEGLLCPTRGRAIEPGIIYCPNDGTNIAKNCVECGTYNKPGARFCSNCGNAI